MSGNDVKLAVWDNRVQDESLDILNEAWSQRRVLHPARNPNDERGPGKGKELERSASTHTKPRDANIRQMLQPTNQVRKCQRRVAEGRTSRSAKAFTMIIP